jgi:hypothetical protein
MRAEQTVERPGATEAQNRHPERAETAILPYCGNDIHREPLFGSV